MVLWFISVKNNYILMKIKFDLFVLNSIEGIIGLLFIFVFFFLHSPKQSDISQREQVYVVWGFHHSEQHKKQITSS